MSDVLALADLAPSQNRRLPSFAPPPRFSDTSFATYRPQHPSQAQALERVQAFIKEAQVQPSFRWPWQPKPQGRGLYLDGGFGVGKTHLLAAAYNAFPDTAKVYLSFTELVYAFGVLGVAQAKAELGNYALYCLDEFELDDPGNTLIVKTFLAHVFEMGGAVITTSNTPPEAQGQGRFNASDFKREIQSVAERFEVVPVGGPDYRQRHQLARLLSENDLLTLLHHENVPSKVTANWHDLFRVLAEHHPIGYRALLEQIGTLYIFGAQPIPDQNAALRFVHFIDKLYDLRVGLRIAGDVTLSDLFAPSYRDSAYAKKHYRCLSRISELLEDVQPELAGQARSA